MEKIFKVRGTWPPPELTFKEWLLVFLVMIVIGAIIVLFALAIAWLML